MTTPAPGAMPPINPQPSLRDRVRRAAMWRIGSSPLLMLTRLVANIILARLLFPDAFGAVALALAMMRGLQMLSETGVNLAIVRDRRDDERFLNTAWTIQAGRGIVLFVAACAITYPLSHFYDEPWLLKLMPFVALVTLIGGFNATAIWTLNRDLDEKPRVMMDVWSAVVMRGTMVAWALISPTPWALVGGTVAGALFTLVYSHTMLAGVRNRITWDADAARSLFRFGSWIFVGTLIAFFAQQMDRLLLGKLEAIAMLGVYTIALSIARVPSDLAGNISGRVLYPVFAELVRTEPQRMADRYLKTRQILMSIALPLMLAMVLLSPWFFRLMYDDRYADAIWIAPLAGVGVWFVIINETVNRMLLAMGRTRVLAFSGAVKLVVSAALSLLGYHLAGVAGFVLGLACGAFAEHAVDVWALRRAGISVIKQDVMFTAALLLITAAAYGGNAVAGAMNVSAMSATITQAALCATILLGASAWSLRRNLHLVMNRS